MPVLNFCQAANIISYFHFLSFHCTHFSVNQVKKSGVTNCKALMQSSYGVPEGQPQCKSSPFRKEVQDVAKEREKQISVPL